MSITQLIFFSLVFAIAIQRILAIHISKKNEKYLKSIGGKKHSDNFLWFVKLMQISWFIAIIGEIYISDRSFIPLLALASLLITIISQILRYLSMRELGYYWTHSIITLSEKSVVNTGIYRYLKHPTWLAMSLEFAFVPLIHNAYLSAIVFSVINAYLMTKRIPTEEKALSEDTNYGLLFNNTPRLIPFFSPNKTNLLESN